jgi:hypothetical protein
MNTDFSYFHLNNVQIVVFDSVSCTLPVLKAERMQTGTFETILHKRRLYTSYKTFRAALKVFIPQCLQEI